VYALFRPADPSDFILPKPQVVPQQYDTDTQVPYRTHSSTEGWCVQNSVESPRRVDINQEPWLTDTTTQMHPRNLVRLLQSRAPYNCSRSTCILYGFETGFLTIATDIPYDM